MPYLLICQCLLPPLPIIHESSLINKLFVNNDIELIVNNTLFTDIKKYVVNNIITEICVIYNNTEIIFKVNAPNENYNYVEYTEPKLINNYKSDMYNKFEHLKNVSFSIKNESLKLFMRLQDEDKFKIHFIQLINKYNYLCR